MENNKSQVADQSTWAEVTFWQPLPAPPLAAPVKAEAGEDKNSMR